MSLGPSRVDDSLARFEQQAADFFEPQLSRLGLSLASIEAQELPELEQSLERVDQLMQHPDQLGIFRAKFSAEANSFVIPRSTAEAQLESGALPVLLLRKARILERIKLLRPLDQIDVLRSEIARRIEDGAVRSELLRVLDGQRADQAIRSIKLDSESQSVESALEEERHRRGYEVALAELKIRTDALEKTLAEKNGALEKAMSEKTVALETRLDRLDDKSVSKWDVVAVVFAVLAAIGGALAAVLGIVRLVSGA